MRAVEGVLLSPGINYAPMVVWYGNKIPKCFWDQWKDELKPAGFTWQKFMRLLRLRTDNFLMWYRGIITWEELIKTVRELVEGPLGKEMVKRKS